MRQSASPSNCWRMPPGHIPVTPLARVPRSISITSAIPAAVAWYAIEAPITPPPTIARSVVRMSLHRQIAEDLGRRIDALPLQPRPVPAEHDRPCAHDDQPF